MPVERSGHRGQHGTPRKMNADVRETFGLQPRIEDPLPGAIPERIRAGAPPAEKDLGTPSGD